jgi:flagellin-specific chaperone FliS
MDAYDFIYLLDHPKKVAKNMKKIKKIQKIITNLQNKLNELQKDSGYIGEK